MGFSGTPDIVVWPESITVADPGCARGGGVSHILAEKRGVSFTSFKKMHENAIFPPITGGGRTPGSPYAGSATVSYDIALWVKSKMAVICPRSNNKLFSRKVADS